MDIAYELRDISLSSPTHRNTVENFLAAAGLTLDPAIGSMVVICDDDDNIKGCGALHRNTIKCLALSDDLRGEGIAAALISELVRRAFTAGFTNVRVFTKPIYAQLFRSLGFCIVGETDMAILLESDPSELTRYKDHLRSLHCDGVIVANANPCTNGHLYLIRQAAARCQRLAVIPVADHDSNMFSYADRVAMLHEATRDIDNVVIAQGSDYAISAATFPSYFIKEYSDVARTQAELDLDIFCRHIAPALGASVRFVGTEPDDRLTASYNETMKRTLPSHGINVVEVSRIKDGIMPISASRVRHHISEGELLSALPLIPKSGIPWLLSRLAIRALRMELALTPKPGLVDMDDPGSHKDMDFALMSVGISSLQDHFTHMASVAFIGDVSATALRRAGLDAEKAMLAATGGVNTHKGAIFALGLAVAAAANILGGHSTLPFGERIAEIAAGFDYPQDTHGAHVRNTDGSKGALAMARSGYPDLFSRWLPMLDADDSDGLALHRLLLHIISTLDDTNAIFRVGRVAADLARRRAAEVSENLSIAALSRLNKEYKDANISHGGAADMLSLTIFIRSVLPAIRQINNKDNI